MKANGNRTQLLHPGNLALLEELYERFLEDPESLGQDWKAFFQQIESTPDGQRSAIAAGQDRATTVRTARIADAHEDLSTRTMLLMQAYRHQGYISADLDPLQDEQTIPYNLDPAEHDISEQEMEREVTVLLGGRNVTRTVREITEEMKRIYTETMGVEFRYLTSEERRNWFMNSLEGGFATVTQERIKKRIFQQIHSAGQFEAFLQKNFIGKKRFSLEGAESLIPALYEAIEIAGDTGIENAVIGMAHRGRLNVLYNIMQKGATQIFAEFKETMPRFFVNGDVKYHLGYSSDHTTDNGNRIHLSLAFNPSHLETVNPVVQGSVRARQTRLGHLESKRDLAIMIHGDAAFSGQGINYEIMNMSSLAGYNVGGTLHIIVNNQIGFTTLPREGRSTQFVTDPARMLNVPVLHVNADDPLAVVRSIRIAMQWRNRFATDVFVDLIGYRRHGHNETDEPAFTQPVMYEKIKRHPEVSEIFENVLVQQGISQEELDQIKQSNEKALKDSYDDLANSNPKIKIDSMGGIWQKYKRYDTSSNPDTGVDRQKLVEMAEKLARTPDGFSTHKKIQKLLEERRDAIKNDEPMDWGTAENLAYATLLEDGYPVRFSGQDARRGTFSHRQATLFDQKTEEPYTPLESIGQQAGSHFEIINSLLSETGALGFEYGYSMSDPDSLVVWEAQFGDFVNSAQVIIDQFISSSEAKWGKMNGLVMLLPHGYEGMGPEHSSGRMERFLQLCSLNNMQVAVPTLPAQMFHLLRRQMHRNYRKPLVVFTPKSLLRHPEAVSTTKDLEEGTYRLVIDETESSIDPKKVNRLILCTGKVYYDLKKSRQEKEITDVALVRVEQLYPYPTEEINRILKKYENTPEIAWVQEEPMNQGAWSYMRNRLYSTVREDQNVVYSGRVSSSSPATGFASVHKREQQRIMDTALDSEFKSPDMKFFCELWS